jgi:hypothetical protein
LGNSLKRFAEKPTAEKNLNDGSKIEADKIAETPAAAPEP